MARAAAALDVQTGGGEVLAGIPRPPPRLAATESWPPNIAAAKRNLRPLGASVIAADDEAGLPFREASFDLVVSRHPTVAVWPEIARVLRPGGTYLSQQVGAGSNRELTDFMMGPQPVLLVPGRLDAALAVWLTLGRHLVARLTGGFGDVLGTLALLTRKHASPLGLAEIVPVHQSGDQAEPITSRYWSLQAIVRANGWILVPSDSEGYPAGAEVVVRALP